MPLGFNDTRGPYKYNYQSADAADVVIKNEAGYLHAIIVGKSDDNATIEVSDHASDGDGNVQIYLEGAPVGVYPIELEFTTGICADLASGPQRVTFVWK